MSIECTWPLASAIMGGILLLSPLSEAAEMPLAVAVDPAAQAEELVFSWATGALPPIALASGSTFMEQPLETGVPLGTEPLTNANLAVRWESGSRSNFPLVVGSVFSTSPVYVKILQSSFEETPSQANVSRACVQIVPSDADAAFEMYFKCRAMALRLETARREWQKPHRTALQGWLVANYYLYTRIAPVSPYGADPDLIRRLQKILTEHERDSSGDWSPLRLDDARSLIRYEADRAIRLAGTVPQLVELGQFEMASAVNSAALTAITDGNGSPYRISAEVLQQNQIFIDNRLGL